jgi:NAD(P)-dependent dehydrogenase (short-subunit alcohol dehydrogenase family)
MVCIVGPRAVDSGARAFRQSKLANLQVTYELSRRLSGTSVTANAVHPGLVSISLGTQDPGSVQRLLVPFLRPFIRTPAQGAVTSIRADSGVALGQAPGPPSGSHSLAGDEVRHVHNELIQRGLRLGLARQARVCSVSPPREPRPSHPLLPRSVWCVFSPRDGCMPTSRKCCC